MTKNNNIDNIKNYAKQIKTLETFVEAVRMRPGMYIGSIGNKGFLNMIREIFQNALDELMKPTSPCDKISLYYNEITHEVIVTDNGRGIPFDNMIRIFSSQHTSSNYTKQEGEYSSGLHGVGSKVTNALSSSFIVESYILGKARTIQFINGTPWDKGEVEIPNTKNLQGTIVRFRPCYDIMGQLDLPATEVLQLVKRIMMLTNIGAVAEFGCTYKNGTTYNEVIKNEDGLLADIINKTTNPLIKPIYIKEDTGIMKADILFTYDANSSNVEQITAYSNFCPTVAGTHINGFIDGLCKYFREYMNKIYLNKSKVSVVNNDIKTGLVAIVTVSHLEPIFDGQSKETLSNADMFPFVKNLVFNSLEEWAKQNPNDLQKMCKYLKEIAEIRIKSDGEKIKLFTKYTTNALSKGLPAKYERPAGNSKSIELIITEGDSAAGSAKNVRSGNQGLYPIRGKVPNALATTKKKFLENEEISGIISIIGAGYGRSFDMAKTNVEKVIFATDADPDGAHIRSLLLLLFMVYMPDMIKDGRIYAAVPPLFGLKQGKDKTKYFIDMIDYIKFTEKSFSKNNEICTLTGNRLNTNDIIDVLYKNADFQFDLKNKADKYAIEPELVELVLANIELPFNKLKSLILKKYRFMKDCSIINNTPVIKGLINGECQTLILNDQFLKDFKDIIEQIKNNQYKNFLVNGKAMSLYGLLNLYNNSKPSGITRYKGLGEMNPEQLRDSTILADERTLFRYTMEDATKEVEAIKRIESNKYELIKNVTVSRRDLF